MKLIRYMPFIMLVKQASAMHKIIMQAYNTEQKKK